MTILVVVIILIASIALVSVVLHLEMHQPAAPITTALRSWQTGIAAVFGLASIAISVAVQSYEADRLQRAQLLREGVAMALSMQQEALQISLWLHQLDQLVSGEEPKLAAAKTDSERMHRCGEAVKRIQRRRYEDLGIIDANRTSFGKMPGMLGIHYIGLSSAQRDLLRRIAESDCRKGEEFDVALTFNVIKEGMGNVRSQLKHVEKSVANLPETTRMTVRFTTSDD